MSFPSRSVVRTVISPLHKYNMFIHSLVRSYSSEVSLADSTDSYVVLILSATVCLVIGALGPLTFKVIIDTFVLTVILLFSSVFFFVVFFFLLFSVPVFLSCSLPLGFDDFIVMFYSFLFTFCVSIRGLWLP